MENRQYLAIDLKSFYASAECAARGLDPLKTHLVVADAQRTEKTICLAVSPSLKAYGISGRARLFEVVQQVGLINARRQALAPGRQLTGKSTQADVLQSRPELALDYIVAPPRMALYMQISAQVYQIYLQYAAPEDIHVYSIDEVFIDTTPYLRASGKTAREFAMQLILEVLRATGITATAGIGTNLYLAKVAMDVGAKRLPPDKNGVRIAELDELRYRQLLWTHRPLTDFWRVGPGYAKKLAEKGLYTMGDIARCSLGGADCFYNETLLYRLFGVNAELLIDHAWGYEPCTLADIRSYQPRTRSLSTGQVLQRPYSAAQARLVVREMADALALELAEKRLETDQLVLHVGYDVDCLRSPQLRAAYRGPVTTDHYGRQVPKPVHGSQTLAAYTASCRMIVQAVTALFDRLVDGRLLVRRMSVAANRLLPEGEAARGPVYEQLDLFADAEQTAREEKQRAAAARERNMQRAVLEIQKKYGKNALLRGMSLQEGATSRQRNGQIGGHRA